MMSGTSSHAVPDDYGSPVFAAWRDAASATWKAYTRHRFVTGLGDGSLPHKAFVGYLIQDYIFLLHFSRAWAMAVVKSETADQMRTAAATVNALINEEIQLHIEVCANEGISESQLLSATEEPENLAYTRYVMDAGISGDLLDLLATLAPCVFGYGEIGRNLADSHTALTYKKWIDTYNADDYQQVCVSVANLIELAAAAKLGPEPKKSPRWPSLCRYFETATNLEVNFWSMGMRLANC